MEYKNNPTCPFCGDPVYKTPISDAEIHKEFETIPDKYITYWCGTCGKNGPKIELKEELNYPFDKKQWTDKIPQ